MKRLVLVLLVVAVVLIGLAAARQAVAAPGDSPINSTTLNCDSPVTVPPGASIWYQVTNLPNYQVHLTIPQPPGGGLSFAVYSAEQAAAYGTDHQYGPMGIGTPLGIVPRAPLNWEGHYPNGGILYVLVKNTSPNPLTLNFTSCANGGLQTEILPLPPSPSSAASAVSASPPNPNPCPGGASGGPGLYPWYQADGTVRCINYPKDQVGLCPPGDVAITNPDGSFGGCKPK